MNEKRVDGRRLPYLPVSIPRSKTNIPRLLVETEIEMKKAADRLDFERAIVLREKLKELQRRIQD